MRLLFVALIALLVWGAPAGAQGPGRAPQVGADKRVALVVGISRYQHIPPLDNPKNDARLMADTLRDLGFALVGGGPQLDLDKPAFDRAVQNFGRQATGAHVALFYYAGHGLQVRGTNWLVPTGANPAREADADFQLVDAGLVLRQMEGAGARLNLLILDACRNNPFGGRGLRSATGGLAQMQAPEGTLISYATQPGNVAADGADGNSPFTKALAQSLRRPGLDVFRTFNEVGLQVKRATGGTQQPWVSNSPIEGDFYFAGGGMGVLPTPTAAGAPPAAPANDPGAPASQQVAANAPPPLPPPSVPYGTARAAYDRKDYRDALRLFRSGADAGDAASMAGMGALYALGIGMPANDNEAIRWFKKAAAVNTDWAPEINRLMASADLHTAYLTEPEFRELMVSTRGEFGGLGIEIGLTDGRPAVIAPIDDTPAAQAGLQAGDLFMRIDDVPTDGLSLTEAVTRLRGRPGTTVRLTIQRATQPLFDITLTRAVIRVRSVKSSLEDGRIGYVRISQFQEQTGDALDAALDALARQAGGRLDGLVLDLRNDPGGLLNQAVAVASKFLDRGVVLRVAGWAGRPTANDNTYSVNGSGDKLRGAPIVVLVNGGSASASEIVSGALQDHRRALVLGTQSFGKGTVQTIMALDGYGALKVTTAEYQLPSGRSIQARGIVPDERVLPANDERRDGPSVNEASLRGSASTVPLDPSIDHKLIGTARDEQRRIALQRVRELAAQRR